jgi:hypothetical protein
VRWRAISSNWRGNIALVSFSRCRYSLSRDHS